MIRTLTALNVLVFLSVGTLHASAQTHRVRVMSAPFNPVESGYALIGARVGEQPIFVQALFYHDDSDSRSRRGILGRQPLALMVGAARDFFGIEVGVRAGIAGQERYDEGPAIGVEVARGIYFWREWLGLRAGFHGLWTRGSRFYFDGYAGLSVAW